MPDPRGPRAGAGGRGGRQLRGIGRNPAMLGEVMRQIAEQRRQSVAELEKEKAAIEREMEKTTLEMGGLAAGWLNCTNVSRARNDDLGNCGGR